MWLRCGNTSSASVVSLFSATVAVAAPLSATISTPASRKRFHIPHQSEGGRSSFMLISRSWQLMGREVEHAASSRPGRTLQGKGSGQIERA